MNGPTTLLLVAGIVGVVVALWVGFDRWLDQRSAHRVARQRQAEWSALVLQVQRAREDFAPPANSKWSNDRWTP